MDLAQASLRQGIRLVALVLLFLGPAARTGHCEGGFWWIDNVAIVAGDPAEAHVIENGTLVVRDGVIVAAGPEAAPLPDMHLAERMDGTGLVAHAAFIDAWTKGGVEGRNPAGLGDVPPPDAREGPRARMRAAQREGVTPERSVLEVWRPGRELLERYRRAGFAFLHVAESRGFLPGRTALVATHGRPLRDCVVAPGCAQVLRFARASRGYPGSLMGSIAFLRQVLNDARRHRRIQELYREDPAGLPPPPFDPSLEALHAVLDGAIPVLVEARERNEIDRALGFCGEFGLRPILAGAREAHRSLRRVAARGAAVVLVPAYGDEPKVEPGPGRPPRRVQEERLRRWKEDIAQAASLVKAGVSCAFASGSDAGPDKLLSGVRRAIEGGLSPWQALRLLTLEPAEILGVERSVGSIAPGKAAHIVLRVRRKGDPPFDVTRAEDVRWLFAGGERFEFRSPEKAEQKKKAEGASQPSAPPEKEGAAVAQRGKPPAEEGAERPAARSLQPKKQEREQEPETELREDRKPRLRTGGNVLVKGGTVLTLTGKVLPATDVRVVSGKIEAIGPGLAALDGMAVIDARGLFVMPGIVDCHSHLAIDGGVNEGTDIVTCEVRIRDVLDPRDVGLYRALAGGVTTLNILHGSANVIGGQNCVIRNLYGAETGEDLIFPGAPEGVKFALGENPRQSNWSRRGSRFPQTRMGVEAVIRRAFAEARRYKREAEAYLEAVLQGRRSYPPRRDLRLEALVEILEGRRWIHCHSYRADEILMLLDTARDLGLRVATLQHVLEGYKVAPEIAAAGVGASTFSDWWAYKLEAFDAIPHNAALMTRAGVVVSINSDSAELVRHLNLEAAKCMRFGRLSAEEALRLITINPAVQLGIADRVGTLEVGKDADMAIFDGHPLSVYSRCVYTLIQGEVRFERRRPLPPRSVAAGPPSRKPGSLEFPGRNAQGVYFLYGAEVHPIASEPIPRGAVLIENGRIKAVGAEGEITPPPEATAVDAGGFLVVPGFIDAGSYLGLTEIGSVAGSVDTREIGTFQPDLIAADAFNAHSELVPVARQGGVTATAVFALSPTVPGQAGFVRLRGTSTAEMVHRPAVALHVVVPRVEPGKEEESETLRGLKDLFAKARRHLEARRAARAGGRRPPRPDPRLEALDAYVEKRLPVVFTADREQEIRLAVRLAGELDVRAVIRGGRDAWKAASLLKEKEIPVIVGPVLDLPSEPYDPYDAPYANPGRLARAGIPFAFQTNHAALVRNLPLQAGVAVAYGLPYEAALEALTLGAARILGVADELGSLEPGKLADLVVWNGDPLEPTAEPVLMFIGGEPVSLESRHTRLWKRFRERIQPRRTRL